MTDIVDKMREARLRWFGHMLRREGDEPAKMALEIKVEGHRGRGRPRQRWVDCVRSDMELKGLRRMLKIEICGLRGPERPTPE